MKINAHLLKKEEWFSIAKCVDNEFAGNRSTFTAERGPVCYTLTTNVCDSCSIVKVHYQTDGCITTIMRIGNDTDGYIGVHRHTYERVFKMLKRNKTAINKMIEQKDKELEEAINNAEFQSSIGLDEMAENEATRQLRLIKEIEQLRASI